MSWKEWLQKNRVLNSRRGWLGIIAIICLTLIALYTKTAVEALGWAIASVAGVSAGATAFQNKGKKEDGSDNSESQDR